MCNTVCYIRSLAAFYLKDFNSLHLINICNVVNNDEKPRCCELKIKYPETEESKIQFKTM